MKKLCKCGKLAVWMYMPKGDLACDECVPRGCSCNFDLKEGIDFNSDEASDPSNWTEELDNKGRKIPCIEWWYDENGYDEDESPIDILKKDFEKNKN